MMGIKATAGILHTRSFVPLWTIGLFIYLSLKREAEERGVQLTIIVDIVHIIEYLWKADRVFHPESGSELEGWVRH
ncbi:MAG: hypothetical protein KJP07_22060, partial [Desulfatitalea sp.]|nr:hypothetical protein [Desulfatitalea sp.]